MKSNWKPSEQLISLLRECDIDSDILISAISQPLVVMKSYSQVSLAQDFTRKVVDQNISWNNFYSRSKSLHFDQGNYLQKDWRPKESTMTLIQDELKLIGRIEIGEYRLSFLEIYKGIKMNSWDSVFIKFVLDAGSEYREAHVENNDKKYPLHIQIINKIKIRKLVKEVLSSTYITPYFNKPLDDSWRPSSWVIKKLENKFNLSKGFILNEVLIRRPFISIQYSKGAITDDYDVLYFHWVQERYYKYHNLLLEEKKRLEKIVTCT